MAVCAEAHCGRRNTPPLHIAGVTARERAPSLGLVSGPPASDARTQLRADCSRCAGLCCVAPAFAASADFAIDKPAGRACPNLRDDFRCGIHAQLRERGFPGCEVFDCFGAGQHLTQVTFGGRSWRETPELAAAQFAVLPVLRQLHETLWYLSEALTLPAAAALHGEVRTALDDHRGPDRRVAGRAGRPRPRSPPGSRRVTCSAG